MNGACVLPKKTRKKNGACDVGFQKEFGVDGWFFMACVYLGA